jgi:ABC-2 type transport system permease protein
MKSLDIALKDMLRSFRSAFSVVMMFIVPLLITGLIYLAFGGMGGTQITIKQIKLAVVNLDQSTASSSVNLGNELVKALTSDSLKNLIAVTPMPDEASARQAILDKKVSDALIIPADLTSATFAGSSSTNLVLYQDPASTISPAIVKSILAQFVNGLNGSKIAVQVVMAQLQSNGITVDSSILTGVAQDYASWSTKNVPDQNGILPFVTLESPVASAAGKPGSAAIAGVIMSGMVIYFVFYTGALNAQSILREQDEQTLARILSTPTSAATILGGKVIGSMLLISVQTAVLMVLSHFFFGIDWGNPFIVGGLCLVMVFLASGFGIFLMSFVKTIRQTGPVLGGVLTVLGMAGGLFTGGFQNLPKGFETITLFTPHGWALRGFKIALGSVSGSIWLPILVMLGIGAVSMLVGLLMFRRRLA